MMSRIPDHPRAQLSWRPLRARAFSSALCVALAGAIVTTAVPAAASPVPLLTLAPEGAAGTVLGLDGKDASANNNLTNALRKAFANRGISGGEEISLEEMRLTMGCSNDEVSCLAQGGKTLGVRRLVFGYLRPGGGGYTLDIQILDVDSGQLEAQASIAVTKAELAADKIDAKATAIVNELIPPEDTDSDLPPRPDPLPETNPEETGEPEDEPPPPKESNIYFGLEKPTPRWKWGAFGTSLALTILAGGATAGMGIWLTAKKTGFRAKLLDAANASLDDDNELNDVDPTMSEAVNLCEFARTRPVDADGNPLGEPGQVRNSAVVQVCNDADDVRTAQIGAGVGTAVFGVATLVFTGVLLIHKRKPGADAMLRHGVRIGVAPTPAGGLTVAGGLRF